jgi:hypothetical protein
MGIIAYFCRKYKGNKDYSSAALKDSDKNKENKSE